MLLELVKAAQLCCFFPLLKTLSSNHCLRYGRLCEVVDHVFPLLIRGNTSDFPCSDTYSQFTYWREQLPEIDKHNQDAENRES